MTTTKQAQEGQIIRLVEGQTVYAEIPEHCAYENRVGVWKPTSAVVTIGKPMKGLDTSYLAGRYIVDMTSFSGGGPCGVIGRTTPDYYPNGHRVDCHQVENPNIVVSFYQSGSFTAMIEEVEIVGRATKRWEIDPNDTPLPVEEVAGYDLGGGEFALVRRPR